MGRCGGYTIRGSCHVHRTPGRQPVCELRASKLVLLELESECGVYQQAFVLTEGFTHYRTSDRGRTWRSFEMPAAPSMVAKPLTFHSDKKKYGYILYQGTQCKQDKGWGLSCDDVVRIFFRLGLCRADVSVDVDVLHQRSFQRQTSALATRHLQLSIRPQYD